MISLGETITLVFPECNKSDPLIKGSIQRKKGMALSVSLQLQKPCPQSPSLLMMVDGFLSCLLSLKHTNGACIFRGDSRPFCWKSSCSDERCNRGLPVLVLLGIFCGVIQTLAQYVTPKEPIYFFFPLICSRAPGRLCQLMRGEIFSTGKVTLELQSPEEQTAFSGEWGNENLESPHWKK